MKKAITVLGLGAAAVAISVSNASAMEQAQTTKSINLREQPSATSNKVSELQAGAKVTVVENQNGWTSIKTDDGRSGWVSGYYVSNEDQDKAGQKETAENVNGQTEKIENTNVNNNVNNNVNKNVNNNVVNNNVVNNNVNTKNESTSNYDSNSNIKTGSGGDVEVKSNANIAQTPSLNVRIGPSTSNGVAGVIYKGESFKVVSKSSNGWYKVILNDGTTGWASGKYINLTNAVDKTNIEDFTNKKDSNTVKETANSNQGKVNSSVGLNVRSGAGTNNAVMTTLASNAVVNIIGEENGWYKVKLSNGSVGYVGANYITKTAGGTQESTSTNVKTGNEANTPKVTATANEKTTKSGGSVVSFAETLLGTRYSWGGTTTSGFDCSGFTQYVYKHAAGVDIPRVSRAQATAGKAVSTSSMQQGDLLYFDTMGGGVTSHVGIYVGNGKFIHASGSAAKPEYVKISNLSEKWVKLLGARRF